MAVTFRISTPSSSNTNSYASGTFAAATNELIIVFVIATGTTGGTNGGTLTDSIGDTTYTRVTSFVKNGSADELFCFIANNINPSTASRSVTFDCTGDNATGCIIQVYSISSIFRVGLAAIRQTSGLSNQTSTAVAPSATFGSACLTSNPTFAVFANGNNPATITPPTNWVEGADDGYNTPPTGLESAVRGSLFTGTTITWGSTTTSTAWCTLIVEIDVSQVSIAAALYDGASQSDYPPAFDVTKTQGFLPIFH